MENSSISPPSPLSPIRSSPEAFSIWPTLLVAIGILAAAVAGGILGAFMAIALGASPKSLVEEHLTLGLIASQIMTYVPVVIVLLYGLPWLAHRPLGALGLAIPNLGDLAYGIGGAFFMYLAVSVTAIVQSKITGLSGEQKVVSLFAGAHPGVLLNLFIAIAVVVAPFVEELVFRGFVFNALLRRMPLVAAAIISGILFGAVHGEPMFIAPLGAGGAVLAWVYYRSGSLWSSILAHGTFNAINLAGVLLLHVKS